ncbi:glycosyltransferase family 4 protein [Vibrio bivalvicida]|uniref:Glycosyltransferase family 4 protein n=1 Tax=Vibrio bivalvicida TaxID=1276888 RepID=A0ABV4MK21_9VIBR
MANSKNKTLVFDPITFKGGSKIATSDALNVCRISSNEFVVLTVDPEFWKGTEFYAKHNVTLSKISAFSWLMKQHNGAFYWASQIYLMFIMLKVVVLDRGIARIVGASGPGIDMPMYLLKVLLSIEVIQFIHGNVGLSRSIGYCLTKADAVFYLPSTRMSLKAALQTFLHHATKIDDTSALAESYLKSTRYQSFVNGIPASRWPTSCQKSVPICFWAASLLKWKGLDTLIDATKLAAQCKPVALNICFIRPIDTCLPVSSAPVLLKHTEWYEDPENLDEIRSQSNIFVSTSCHEPFGLSILEALAAGMCVVIPQDGSFWDQQLTHSENCIKYQPDSSDSLCDALLYAANDHQAFKRCCTNATDIAALYKAEFRYQRIAQFINGDIVTMMIRTCDQ